MTPKRNEKENEDEKTNNLTPKFELKIVLFFPASHLQTIENKFNKECKNLKHT